MAMAAPQSAGPRVWWIPACSSIGVVGMHLLHNPEEGATMDRKIKRVIQSFWKKRSIRTMSQLRKKSLSTQSGLAWTWMLTKICGGLLVKGSRLHCLRIGSHAKQQIQRKYTTSILQLVQAPGITHATNTTEICTKRRRKKEGIDTRRRKRRNTWNVSALM